MALCLPKDKAQKFLKALKSGEVNPAELMNMTPKGRREFFKKFGNEENAKKINALFEKKIIQKNKLAGLKSWVNTVGGLKETTRRDIIKKIDNLGERITDAELDNFVDDAVEDVLGIKLNQKEFETLSDLTSKVEKYKEKNTIEQLTDELNKIAPELSETEQKFVKNLKSKLLQKEIDKSIKIIKGIKAKPKTTTKTYEQRYRNLIGRFIKKNLSKKEIAKAKAEKISIQDLIGKNREKQRLILKQLFGDKYDDIIEDFEKAVDTDSVLREQKKEIIRAEKETSKIIIEEQNKLVKIAKTIENIKKKTGVELTIEEARLLQNMKQFKGKTKKEVLSTMNDLKKSLEGLENIELKDEATIKKIQAIKQEIKDTEIIKEKARITKLEQRQVESKSPLERSKLQIEIDESIVKIRETHKRIKKLSERINISSKEKEKLQFAIDTMIDTRINEGGMAYGEARAALEMFEQELVDKADKIVNYKGLGKVEKVKETGRLVRKILDTTRGMLTILDIIGSFGRQAYKMGGRHPILWVKMGATTFTTTIKVLRGKGIDPIWGIKANIYARKYRDLYSDRLAIGVREDAMPESLLEKIPGLGRIYKAFEQGYTAGLYVARADIMDKQIERAIRSGIDISPKWLDSMADTVNILTGRGRMIGGVKGEALADITNAAFFSARKIASDFQFLTDPFTDFLRKDVPADVRLQKTYYLAATIAETASILTLAKYFLGDKADIEQDTRSANFGTIKVGDVRIDVTGGMKSFITLAARLYTKEKKSSTKGTISTIGTSFGDETRFDLLTDFFSNKLAPAGNVGMQMLKGKTREGKPLIIEAIKDDPLVYAQWLAGQTMIPMPISSMTNLLKEPNSYPLLAAVFAEQIGFSASNYPAEAPRDWTTKVKYDPKVSKKLKQLYDTVGEERFKAINDEYNKRILSKVNEILAKPEYHALDNEIKKNLFTDLRMNIRDEVIEEMASEFKFKRAKPQTKKEKYNNLLN